MSRPLGKIAAAHDGGGSDVGHSSRRPSTRTHASGDLNSARHGKHRKVSGTSLAALVKKKDSATDHVSERRDAGSAGALGGRRDRSKRGSTSKLADDDYQLRNALVANDSKGSQLRASRQDGLDDRQSVSTFGQQRGTARHSTRGSLD